MKIGVSPCSVRCRNTAAKAVKSSGPTRRTAENARRSEVAPTHGDETGQGRAKGLDAIEPPMELFVRRHTRLLVPLKVFPHGGQIRRTAGSRFLTTERMERARPKSWATSRE